MGRRQILITAVYGVLMAALGSVVFIAPELDSVAWAGIGLCGAGAIVFGIRRIRPQRPGPWWALAGSLVAMMAGDFLFGLMVDAGADPPPLANLCYLAMFPLVATALIGLTRTSAALDDRAGLLDLIALSGAALLAAWVFIVSPRLGTGGVSGTEWSVQAAFTLGDVIVLVVTARLVRAAPRNPSAILLAVGAVGMLAGDVAYGVAQSDGGLAPGGPADLAYVVLYASWGAAALLPSMARLTDPPAAPPPGDVPVRGLGMVLLLAAVAVAPVVLMGQALTGPVHDGPVIAVAFGISLALLVTRLNDAVRRHAEGLRRERTLRHAGTVLVSVTDAGAVAVAVRTAVRELLPADTPHVIVVDSSLTDLLPLNELSAPRIVPVDLTPPLWHERLGEFGYVLVCPLDAAVLYIGAERRDLRVVQDAVTVLAGQAAARARPDRAHRGRQPPRQRQLPAGRRRAHQRRRAGPRRRRADPVHQPVGDGPARHLADPVRHAARDRRPGRPGAGRHDAGRGPDRWPGRHPGHLEPAPAGRHPGPGRGQLP